MGILTDVFLHLLALSQTFPEGHIYFSAKPTSIYIFLFSWMKHGNRVVDIYNEISRELLEY